MENNNKPNTAIEELHRMVEDMQSQLLRLKYAIEDLGPIDDTRMAREKALDVGSIEGDNQETIVEGVFDGQNMVGPDGKVYTVPANYASKSKLVEGDIMKLTIQQDGTFIYKQIGPVRRRRITGTVVREEESASYRAVTDAGKSYRLLTASVTYYKGSPGDAVVMLVPEDMEAKWAAVENIMDSDSEALPDFGEDGEMLDEIGDSNLDDLFLDDGTDGELPSGF